MAERATAPQPRERHGSAHSGLTAGSPPCRPTHLLQPSSPGRAGEPTHRLVEGILNFGRFQSGKYEYRFQTVDLGELAQSVVEDFSASAANREHRVEFRRPEIGRAHV